MWNNNAIPFYDHDDNDNSMTQRMLPSPRGKVVPEEPTQRSRWTYTLLGMPVGLLLASTATLAYQGLLLQLDDTATTGKLLIQMGITAYLFLIPLVITISVPQSVFTNLLVNHFIIGYFLGSFFSCAMVCLLSDGALPVSLLYPSFCYSIGWLLCCILSVHICNWINNNQDDQTEEESSISIMEGNEEPFEYEERGDSIGCRRIEHI
jgi:hypothetical protein